MTERADVIVVGMGPGGEDVAGRLAEAGLDVVGVEAELVGGECPYWGCVPSKMMIRAADLLAEAGRVPGHGRRRPRSSPTGPRWPDASATRPPTPGTTRCAVRRFEDKGGRLVRGWGRLEGPTRVAVGDRSHRGRSGRGRQHRDAGVDPPGGRTGRHPLLDQPRGDRDRGGARRRWPCWEAAPSVSSWPRCSAASAPRSPCSRPGPCLVGPEEPEAGRLLAEVFGSEGIDVRTGVDIESVHHDGHRFAVSLGAGRAGGGRPPAGGHRPACRPGPAQRGLHRPRRLGPGPARRRPPAGRGRRRECGRSATSIGKGAFTHVSMYQADIVVNDILGHLVVPADYRAVPRVTFTDPEIGSVGLSERDARHRGSRCGWGGRPSPSRPGGGSTRRATRASSSWWRTPSGGAGRGHLGRTVRGRGARACSPWPSTPRCPPPSSGT